MKTTKQFKVDTTNKIGGTLYMKPAEWAVLSLMVQNGIPLLPQCSWVTGDKILQQINDATDY